MQLSFSKYGWRCVLGAEIVYALCMTYGLFLGEKSSELHRSLFELLPWFTWGNIGSIIWGAVFVFLASWLFAAYMVWMFNSSMIRTGK